MSVARARVLTATLVLVASVFLASCSNAYNSSSKGTDLPGNWISVAAPEGHELRAVVFQPQASTTGAHPTVLVLHGDEGFVPLYLNVAEQLARHGVLALAGCWFSGRAQRVAFGDAPLDCPSAGSYADSELWPGAITALIDAAHAQTPSSSDRIHLFGNSGGALEAITMASARSDIGSVVAVGGPYDGLQTVPRVPLLMLQGSRGNQHALYAAQQYEQLVRDHGTPVESFTYEGGDYSFLALEPSSFDDVIARSASFFMRDAGQ